MEERERLTNLFLGLIGDGSPRNIGAHVPIKREGKVLNSIVTEDFVSGPDEGTIDRIDCPDVLESIAGDIEIKLSILQPSGENIEYNLSDPKCYGLCIFGK